jgi:hypothetical protein
MEPIVHYDFENCPPLVPILNHVIPVHGLPSSFFRIHFNIIPKQILTLAFGHLFYYLLGPTHCRFRTSKSVPLFHEEIPTFFRYYRFSCLDLHRFWFTTEYKIGTAFVSFKLLKPNGKYMPHLLQQSMTGFFCGFRMILSLNSDYFLKQR